MSLISIVITLAVVGVLLWLFNTYVTMIDATIKRVINIIVIICVVLWLLQALGVWHYVTAIHVP